MQDREVDLFDGRRLRPQERSEERSEESSAEGSCSSAGAAGSTSRTVRVHPNFRVLGIATTDQAGGATG